MASVFIQTDTNNNITAINSGSFIDDINDWVKIDEGDGDKYAHAQNNYLPKSITDEYGRYNYRYVKKKVREIPEEDKPPIDDEPVISQEMRVEALENALAELIEMLMEE